MSGISLQCSAGRSGEVSAANISAPPQSLAEQVSHWEFWPAWAISLPMIPWWFMLALRDGPTSFTASNPAIPLGGLVGESKSAILSRLAASHALACTLLAAGPLPQRLERLAAWMLERSQTFPLILKPDVGERGAGVRLVKSHAEAQEYLLKHPGPTLCQEYHAGPFEAGVFYVRMPGAARGSIFSVTDKIFPCVKGDGAATLEELIRSHPRLHVQASVFLERLGTRRKTVPARGEEVRLALAGNHCQGTLFCDGGHLATPLLAGALDRSVAEFEGFCFGRFDLRYRDAESLRLGRDFGIIELNGVLSESTNIYDPRCGFWQGQRILRAQWELASRIGKLNRSRGARAATLIEVFEALAEHLDRPNADTTAD